MSQCKRIVAAVNDKIDMIDTAERQSIGIHVVNNRILILLLSTWLDVGVSKLFRRTATPPPPPAANLGLHVMKRKMLIAPKHQLFYRSAQKHCIKCNKTQRVMYCKRHTLNDISVKTRPGVERCSLGKKNDFPLYKSTPFTPLRRELHITHTYSK